MLKVWLGKEENMYWFTLTEISQNTSLYILDNSLSSLFLSFFLSQPHLWKMLSPSLKDIPEEGVEHTPQL